MNESQQNTSLTTRREFIKTTGRLAAASALAGVALPRVHAAGGDMIQLALIGCGGRGTGAVADAVSTSKSGPIKLVAMADVFPNRLNSSYETLRGQCGPNVDVPPDRRFVGFDAYQKAMDCLKPGDVAIFATPPAFRWVHFAYAIRKGLNVFMEKPVTVDGPSSRRMLKLNEEALARNLKVGVGLMCRHCQARAELLEQIQAGKIGDIILMRAYRMHGPVGFFSSGPKPADMSDLMYQVQRFHSFLWASGGAFSDFYIHNIDECCWMKGAWPVQAHALGGRHYRGDTVDQNFDIYSVEYTFADGTKLMLEGRCINGCHDEFASYAHGTKGLGIISTASHTPARCRIFKGHNIKSEDLVWRARREEPNPYQEEWVHLIDAIRQNKPYNEVKRGVEASLVTSMGRMAAHTGQIITYEDMLNCDHEFAPDLDKLTASSPAPLQPGPDGKYPIPAPGINRKREY
ncbi:MAG TPA: Gfo/Idh/MocA family oxidoreductase [Candidatus Paceibacterota bacterium]|nr:Gfo/Idh/MocA family oxidoreductase [Candidatus Paceibacterota bacterium]